MIKRIFLLALFAGWLQAAAWAATSEELRSKQWLYLDVVAGSYDLSSKFAPTYKIGLHLGRFFLVGIENSDSFGSTDFDFGNGESISNLQFHSRGVFVRWFVGNSFNLLLAQYRREFATEYYYKEEPYLFAPGRSVRGKLKGEIEVRRYGFGNLWSFDDGFSVGIDWFVQTQTLQEDSSATLISQKGYAGDLSAQQRLETSAQNGVDYFKLPGVGILTIGYSF